MHHSFTRGGTDRNWSSWTATLRRLMVGAVILTMVGASAAPAAGQADEDAGTYASPTFGYEMRWDPDDYTVEREATPTSQSTRDFLRLDTNDADDEGLVTGILFIEGTDQDWDDPDDCVTTVAREIDVRVSRDEPLEDPETGDPFTVSDDGIAAAGFYRTDEDDNGDERTFVTLFTCVQDPGSALIVAFTQVSVYINSYFEDAYPAYQDLVDSLTFPGGREGVKSRGPGESDPASSKGAGATEEPTPTPAPDGTPTNIDGNTWLVEQFGVGLTWDPDVWEVESEEIGDLYAALDLNSDLLTTKFVPYRSGDGDVQTCLTNYLNILNERGEGTAAIIEADGEQQVSTSDDGTQLSAFIAYTSKDVDFVSRIVCLSLNETDVLAMEFTGTPDDLLSDEGVAQVEELLGGLLFRAES